MIVFVFYECLDITGPRIAGTPYRLIADATLASRIGRPSPPGLPRGGGTPGPSDPGEIPILDTDPDPGSVMHRWTPCAGATSATGRGAGRWPFSRALFPCGTFSRVDGGPPATSTPHDPVDRRAERHTATPVAHTLGMVYRSLGPWVVDGVGRGRVRVHGWSMEGARAGRGHRSSRSRRPSREKLVNRATSSGHSHTRRSGLAGVRRGAAFH